MPWLYAETFAPTSPHLCARHRDPVERVRATRDFSALGLGLARIPVTSTGMREVLVTCEHSKSQELKCLPYPPSSSDVNQGEV